MKKMIAVLVLACSTVGFAQTTQPVFTPQTPTFTPTEAAFSAATPASFSTSSVTFSETTSQFTPSSAVFEATAQIEFTLSSVKFSRKLADFTTRSASYVGQIASFAASQATFKGSPYNLDNLAEQVVRFIRYAEVFGRNSDIARRRLFLPVNVDTLDKWAAVYSRTYPPIAEVQLPTGLRMVSELRAPTSDVEYENFTRELDYFAAQKYNALLLAWYMQDDPRNFDKAITYAKSKGFKVWFAFGGSIDATDIYAMDPSDYYNSLQHLAKQCDGFILGWRQTNPGTVLYGNKRTHNYKPDAQFIGYTLAAVRGVNPNIPVLGNLQFFHSEASKASVWKIVPEGVSGIVAFNFGVNTVNTENAMRFLKRTETKKIAVQVMGERYFYLTGRPNNRTDAANRAICRAIEDRYIAAGAALTITDAGDFSDFSEFTTDGRGTSDLRKSRWSQTGSYVKERQ
ncbi:MAG: hypothetical protein FWD61_00365 [Phycisphaerales bacterium]|nr:hypothetical protein [Phycisphaerales bacterium]